MIKSVTVTNYLGDSIKLELMRPDLSGFLIESITGLGPGKADINTTEVSTGDGGLYNSARLSKRNIVIAVKYYNWHAESIETIRQLSYKYFPIKKPLTLLIETDNRTSKIVGYVESNDPNIFAKESGSSISIICPDPYFYSGETNSTIFSGIEPEFQFPFSNESVTEPLLIIGSVRNRTENLIIYSGDANVGVIIRIHSLGDATKIVIHNTQTRESMKIDTDKIETITGSNIKNGDDIEINTKRGEKSVTLTRDGQIINILNCLDKDSDWFQLTKGDNLFAYTAETGSTNLQFTVLNDVIYEGV